MNERFLIDDIPVELRRNRRRRSNIAIAIDPSGVVVLDAPFRTSEGEVENLVREHDRWLRYRLNSAREANAEGGKVGYAPGEIVFYLGKPLVLHEAAGTVRFEPGRLYLPPGDETATRRRVREFYRAQAATVFAGVLDDYVHLPWLGGKLPPWRQRFMKSQWGSCSAQGAISLNTHLVRTPRPLIEYVVLHELCHLRYHNHSRRFHDLVARFMPDWRARSAELGRNTSLLLDE